MTQDPYQPPSSDPNNGPPKRNSLAWVVMFCISASLISLSVLSAALLGTGTVLDLLSLSVSVVSVAGLYGFAFYQPIYKVVFWRYFFYIAVLDFFIFNIIYPLFKIPFFGSEPSIDPQFFIFSIYSLTILYALNQYAYKRPFIWVS